MSNSKLVNHTNISPNKTSPRNQPIRKITIHHVAGNLTVEQVGNIFKPSSRRASSNYGVDGRGRVGMYVEEKDRAWTSGSGANDHQAITIEVSNSGGGPRWPVSDTALEKTIELCVDICKRNDIEELEYTGDSSGSLTRHNMFQATSCPGPYLQSKFPYIADEVNKRLNKTDVLFRVQTGAFSNRENAVRLEDKLREEGFPTYLVKVDNLYKVQVGAFADKTNADRMEKRLKDAGYDTYVTTNDNEGSEQSPQPYEYENKGRRVEAIADRVNFYDTPRWNNPSGQFLKGQGWIIRDHLSGTGGSGHYEVENSKGDVYYITARKDLVRIV